MYNSVVSIIISNLVKEIQSLCCSDIKNLQHICSKEYINDREVSITITQEEYNDYVNSKDS